MIGQQRRQVPRMVRMLGPPGIEVAAGIGKAVPLTACSIVDVKGKEPRFRPGKTCHLRFNNHTIFPLKKTHHSAHRWMAAVPANLGDSNGINISLQTITPDSSYAADPSIESIDKKHNESLCPDTPCSGTRTTCAKKVWNQGTALVPFLIPLISGIRKQGPPDLSYVPCRRRGISQNSHR